MKDHRYYIWLLTLLAFNLPIYSTPKYGIGISPDSLSYIAAAKSLIQSGSLLDTSGAPYALWPPLLPIIFAILITLGIKLELGALLINSLALATCSYVSLKMLRRLVKDKVIFIIGAPLVVLSFGPLKSAVMAWTEPTYGAFLLLSILSLIGYLENKSKRDFFLSALFAGLACLTRYAGITWIVFALALLLVGNKQAKLRSRIGDIALYGIVSLSGIAIWAIRNINLVGCPLGCRVHSSNEISDQLWPTIYSIGRTLFPLFISEDARVLLTIGVLVFITTSFALLFRAKPGVEQRQLNLVCAVCFGYAAFQLVILAIAFSRIANEPISVRYISPIFPLIIIPIIALIDFLLGLARFDIKASSFLPKVVVGLLATWSISLAYNTAQLVLVWREDGAGDYSTTIWKESELLNKLRNKPLNGSVLSNAADFLSYETNLPISSLPIRSDDLAMFVAKIKSPTYGVWFSHSFRRYIVSADELSRYARLTKRTESQDGIVYEISPLKN